MKEKATLEMTRHGSKQRVLKVCWARTEGTWRRIIPKETRDTEEDV